MKLKLLTIACLAAVMSMAACQDDAFRGETRLTPAQATPRNLRYADVVNAREHGLIKSGLPTVETGGLIPAFEIVRGTDAQGQELSASYMDFVSIISPSIVQLGYYDENNTQPIEVENYRHAGTITVAAGNPFSNGDYYFDIRVTTVLAGQQYSTDFARGFTLHVGPELPSALLYVPMAQNLVIGEGKKTTSAYMPSGNPDIVFSLGSDEDKLDIDPSTGALWIKTGYAPTETVTVNPTIVVTSNISGEQVVFEGSSDLVSVVVSTSPVTLPLQEKYFFTPTLNINTLNSGFRKHATDLGNMQQAKLWVEEAASTSAAGERPSQLTNNKSLMNNPTVAVNSVYKPHESWVIMEPQNLSNFNYGFELSATFWIFNRYVAYMTANGLAPCELRILVSTDYNYTMASPESATWTDVADRITSRIFTTTLQPEFTGIPYPGNNALTVVNGSTDNDQAKDLKNTSRHSDNRWTKCVLDLEEWKNATSFTIAFHHVSNFTGTLPSSNAEGRLGRFAVSDVYYKAKEKAQ